MSTVSYPSQLSRIRWSSWPSWPSSGRYWAPGRGPMVFLALFQPQPVSQQARSLARSPPPAPQRLCGADPSLVGKTRWQSCQSCQPSGRYWANARSDPWQSWQPSPHLAVLAAFPALAAFIPLLTSYLAPHHPRGRICAARPHGLRAGPARRARGWPRPARFRHNTPSGLVSLTSLRLIGRNAGERLRPARVSPLPTAERPAHAHPPPLCGSEGEGETGPSSPLPMQGRGRGRGPGASFSGGLHGHDYSPTHPHNCPLAP